MSHSDRKFWPFKPQWTLAATAGLLVVLLLAVPALHRFFDWPSSQSETVVLIGILLLSLLPIAVALLDAIIHGRVNIKYGNFQIDFSRSKEKGTVGITVAANIGVQGLSVSD